MLGKTGSLLALCVAGLLVAAPSAAQPADANVADVVAIENGLLRGVTADGVTAFKGIPYALPPVGDLRWRAPQTVADWDGVRSAEDYGFDCQQTPFSFDATPSRAGVSEDCLYLNVWTPADAEPGDKLPVLFWLYGGGFVNGASSAAIYDGTAFARDGVVLVSANYRLGRFGFFAHPALTAEASADYPDEAIGNYAGLDMIAALEWVQRNIDAFGGDPSDVTVGGVSSGSSAVQALMTTPMAEGLFSKAISQSGLDGRTARNGVMPLSGPDGVRSAEAMGVEIAASLGVTDAGAAGLAELRALPAEEIGGGLNMATMNNVVWIPPMADGRFLLDSPGQRMRDGDVAHVPWLVGATNGDAFFSEDDLDAAYAWAGQHRAAAEAAYDPEGEGDAVMIGTLLRADMSRNEPARYFARLLAEQGQDVYVYRFSYVAESERDHAPLAAHASDVAYVFDTLEAVYGDAVTEADRRAAREAHAYWVAFVKTGMMAPDGLPALAPYDPGAPEILRFTDDGPVVGPDPIAARLDLIESAYPPEN